MAHTYRCGPHNSTPFSSCCGVASQDRNGYPDSHCHKCGEPMMYNDGLAQRRREVGEGCCLMCGKPRNECHC